MLPSENGSIWWIHNALFLWLILTCAAFFSETKYIFIFYHFSILKRFRSLKSIPMEGRAMILHHWFFSLMMESVNYSLSVKCGSLDKLIMWPEWHNKYSFLAMHDDPTKHFVCCYDNWWVPCCPSLSFCIMVADSLMLYPKFWPIKIIPVKISGFQVKPSTELMVTNYAEQ